LKAKSSKVSNKMLATLKQAAKANKKDVKLVKTLKTDALK